MTGSQVNVNLKFNADTSNAKAQIQSLQQSISQLSTNLASQGATFGITSKIQEAQGAVVQLKTALQQSMNINTGKFDLSKFNSSLSSMGTSLNQMQAKLMAVGPAGQQAFMQLAQSIVTAEIPTKRISAGLAALGTTIKNTAKWQISSTLLHGFIRGISTSLNYAKDLNKSLNNIRIVTGESAEAMDQFALRANKAAKALNASTLDYTNAALIFYQQGLKGKEVEERANVTLKLANVSRQSAETVSDQLTAIWNNFYDGSKSLEYYADVLVKLGASTASSTDEIAGGLEKFAAVGETIGLSYEYAAAALATITANTRQSEDVVGTALKTIFSRMQGLKLGETLDDGTTLNKYSAALKAVGVDILDANDQLKNMDTILDETAAKWKTLARDEQAALAQSVAGIRQYTQFIALMDNWDDGTSDSMKSNLQYANNALGTLQDQADIYGESWEAASKRVKAATEEVFSDLLDDDFFIDMTNGLADFLGLIDNLLDSMGGMRGLLLGLGSILLQTFAGSAAKGLENMVYNFRNFVGLTEKEAIKTQQNVMGMLSGVNATPAGEVGATADSASINVTKSQIELKHQLAQQSKQLTEAEKERGQYIIEENQMLADQVVLKQQAVDAAKTQAVTAKNPILENLTSTKDADLLTNTIKSEIQISEKSINSFERLNQRLKEGKISAEDYEKQLIRLEKNASGQLKTEFSRQRRDDKGRMLSTEDIAKKGMRQDSEDVAERMRVNARMDAVNTASRQKFATGKTKKVTQEFVASKEGKKALDDYAKSEQNVAKTSKEARKAQENYNRSVNNARKLLGNLKNSTKSWSETLVASASSIMSISFAINSFKSLFDTWADDTIGAGEKVLQTFMSFGMIIPMLINGISGLNKAWISSITAREVSLMLGAKQLGLSKSEIATMTTEQLMKKTDLTLEQARQLKNTISIAQRIKMNGLTEESVKKMGAATLATKMGITVEEAKIIKDKISEGMSLKKAFAEGMVNKQRGAGVIATIIATVAEWGWVAAMNAALGPTMTITILLVALVAIIWAIVAAFQAGANAYNADAIAAENAAKAAKEISEAYEECKKSYEDMINTMSEYKEAVSALEKLAKGTDEYKEKLQEANRAALELIQNNPGKFKAGQDYEWVDGLLVIKETAMARAKSAGQKQLNTMYAAQQVSQAEAAQAKAKADITQTSRSWVFGQYSEEYIKNNAHKAVAAYQQDQNLFTNKEYMAAQLRLSDQSLINTLWEHKDEMVRLGDSTLAAADSYKLATENAVNELLSLNDSVQNSENKELVVNASDEKLDANYQKALAELDSYQANSAWNQNGWGKAGISQLDAVNDEVKKVWAEYAEAAGLEGTTVTDTYGDDNNRRFAYTTADGEKKEVSLEAMRKVVAMSRAEEETNAQATALTEVADKFDNIIKKYQKDDNEENAKEASTAKNLLFGNFEDYRDQDYSDLSRYYGQIGYSDIKAMGYESMTEFQKAIEAQIEKAKWARQEIVNSWDMDYEDSTSKYFTYGLNKLTNKQLEELDFLSKGLKIGMKELLDENGLPKLLELNEKLTSIDFSQGIVNIEELGDAYNNLGEKTKTAVEKFIELQNKLYVLETGMENLNKMNSKLSSSYAEFEESFEDPEVLEQYYKNLAASMNVTVDQAKQMAKNSVLAGKGLKTLNEKIDDFNILIQSGSKNTVEFAQAMVDLRNVLLDMYGVEVSDEFLKGLTEEDLNMLRRASKGAKEDIEQFRKLVQEDAKKQVLKIVVELNDEEAIKQLNSILNKLQTIANTKEITEVLKLDARSAIETLNNMLFQGKISAETLQGYFNSIGWAAQITEKKVPVSNTTTFKGKLGDSEFEGSFTTISEVSVPVIGNGTVKYLKDSTGSASGDYNDVAVAAANKTLQNWGDSGVAGLDSEEGKQNFDRVVDAYISTYGIQGDKNDATVRAEAIKRMIADQNDIEFNQVQTALDNGGMFITGPTDEWMEKYLNTDKFQLPDLTGMNPYDENGSKNTVQVKNPVEPKKKEEELERYFEINNAIEDQNNLLDILATKKDMVYGQARVKIMDEEIAATKEALELGEEYLRQSQAYLEYDKQNLSKYGIEFDINGRISNLEAIWEQQAALWETTQNALLQEESNYEQEQKNNENYDADGRIKLDIENRKKQSDEDYENFMNAISKYNETIDTMRQQMADNLAKELEIKQKEFEKLEYTLSFKIEINESEVERIEYYLDRISNNFYNAAEGVAKYGEQIPLFAETIAQYGSFIDNLQIKYDAGAITTEDYLAGMQDGQSGLIDTVSELEAAWEAVGEYYLSTLDLANEKIERQIAKYEGFTEILEHYKAVISLTKGEQDYNNLNKIISAQRKITEDQITISQSKLAMYNQQQQMLQEELNKPGISQDAKDKIENDLATINELIAEEQSNIVSYIATLGEIALEELTNTLGEAKKKLQEALFGDRDLTVDSMMSQIERLNAKQEEYLTNTNKLYETNKLIRQAQMDMDKTDNKRAKQHYDDYIKYIEQLQQSGQLSQFELELAQAEYDILQKKIALEEAQEAKNQVRLTRDAEGNYGYVYTANQENIDKAQQEFEDAQNARYNIALEGAQKYQDQYYQAISDMQEALEELEEQRSSKLISDEEYEKRRVEITETYLSIAQTAHDLYYKATGVMMDESANKRLDYTLKGVSDMETLKNATEVYLEDSRKAFDTYDQKIEEVSKHSETNFGKVSDGIQKVTDESGELTQYLTNELIPVLNSTLSQTLYNSMLQWYDLEKAVRAVRLEVEKYLEIISQENRAHGASTNYAEEIRKEYEKGENANMEYIARLAELRDLKLNNLDLTDYSQLMADYLAADPNHTKNDPLYKTYEYLRQHKLEKWDELDFSEMYDLYIKGGGDPNSQTAQDILTARSQKINTLGITDAISNEDLVRQTAEKYKPQIITKNSEEDEEIEVIEPTVPVEPSAGSAAGGNGGDGNEDQGDGDGPPGPTSPESVPQQKYKYYIGWKSQTGQIGRIEESDFDYDSEEKARKAAKEVAEGYGLGSFLANRIVINTRQNGSSLQNIPKYDYDIGSWPKGFVDGYRIGDAPTGEGMPWYYESAHNSGWYSANNFLLYTWFNGAKLIDVDFAKNVGKGMWMYLIGDRWYNADQIDSFDTGGYTGNWGPEGKMAMLHEKELVLNKHDTENFLSAATMLREISQMLDNNALIASLGAINLSAMTIGSPADQVLQQEVTIHADFPNVTDHNEIEIAIDNLINAASQHAYRT